MGSACTTAANEHEDVEVAAQPEGHKQRTLTSKTGGGLGSFSLSNADRHKAPHRAVRTSNAAFSGECLEGSGSHNLTFTHSTAGHHQSSEDSPRRHVNDDPLYYPNTPTLMTASQTHQLGSSAQLESLGGDTSDKPPPLSTEDEDMLCDRDDDPPIIDDEVFHPTSNPTAVFHSNAAAKRHRRSASSVAPSLHSARKSTVSFSESVSVHYDNPAHDEEEDADERGTMNFDLEDDDERSMRDLHHPQSLETTQTTTEQQQQQQQPMQTLLSPHSPGTCSMVASPAGQATGSTLSAQFSSRNQLHQRGSGALAGSDDASSVSAMLLHPTVFSDVSSVTSSRCTVITVRISTENASHREQRARPRL